MARRTGDSGVGCVKATSWTQTAKTADIFLFPNRRRYEKLLAPLAHHLFIIRGGSRAWTGPPDPWSESHGVAPLEVGGQGPSCSTC